MGRDWRVDTLRGYFLVAMTLGHFPNPLAQFTEYSFGYASSPDGFVFLSGLVSTWVYLPLSDKRGPSAMFSRVFRRAGTIYLTHIALLVVGILAALFPGAVSHAHPLRTFLSGVLLWNQGGFDRILPMYCIFLAFTPVVLKQFRDGRGWLVGCVSAGLWLGAQFGFGDSKSGAAGLDPATFNLCAWQAYFVAGQYFGYRGLGSSGTVVRSRALLAACSVVALLLMVDRHLLSLWGMSPVLGFNAHPDHNPVRFLDAACIGYLLWWIPRSVDLAAMKLRFFRFLNLLGGHSLQVFAFSMLVTRFEAHTINTFSTGARLIVALITVSSLGIPALLHQFFRERALDHGAIVTPAPVSGLPAA